MNFKKIFSSKKSTIQKPKLTNGTEKVVKSLVKSKLFNEEEISMICGLTSIKKMTVRELMIPRVDVIALSANIKPKELRHLLQINFYSRFPVYDQNIDDIKGVVHIRDIFQKYIEKTGGKDSSKEGLIKLCKEPLFIPESRWVWDVLKDLQNAHIQMAIVVDEYGGFSGIITMENILEEIIGDVQDESDEEIDEIIELEPMLYSVDARSDLEEINQEIGIHLEDDKADTIGGYLVNLFGSIPKKNQSIEAEGILFTVKTKKGNSITRVKIDISKTTASPDTD